jgi:Bacteriodetes cell division protein (FtsL-like)
MATNTFRPSPSAQKMSPKKGRSAGILDKFSLWVYEKLDLGDQLPTSTLKHLLWISLLLIMYIYVQHSYEGFIRKIDKSKSEVEELRAAYITQKSKYMYASKQSEIAKKLAPQGLQENITPPNKIVVSQ